MSILDWDAAIAACIHEIDQAEWEISMINQGLSSGDPFEHQLSAARAESRLAALHENPWPVVNAGEVVTRESLSPNIRSVVSSDGTIAITGYASVTNREYPVYDAERKRDFMEVVHRGAFAKTLADGAELDLRLDHDGPILATTVDDTLKLSEDEIGLRFDALINVNRFDAIELLRESGQCSFQFDPIGVYHDERTNTQHVTEVDLDGLHVCLTRNPANPFTSASFTADGATAKRLDYLFSELERYGI